MIKCHQVFPITARLAAKIHPVFICRGHCVGSICLSCPHWKPASVYHIRFLSHLQGIHGLESSFGTSKQTFWWFCQPFWDCCRGSVALTAACTRTQAQYRSTSNRRIWSKTGSECAFQWYLLRKCRIVPGMWASSVWHSGFLYRDLANYDLKGDWFTYCD